MKSFNDRFNVKTTLKLTGCAAPFRTTLMLINGVFILIALGLIGLSVYGYVHFHPLGQIISTDIPTGVLLVAVLMLSLSLIGFIGTYRNNRCLLMIYLVVLLILLVCQTVVAIMAHNHGSDVSDVLHDGWVKAYNSNPENVNLIQAKFCCCGFYNYTDYQAYNCFNETTITYPYPGGSEAGSGSSGSGSGSTISCAETKPAGGWPGCGSLLTTSYTTPMKVITGVSFTVAALEALAVLFTFILFSCITCCSWEEEEVDPYRDPNYDSAPLMDEYRPQHHHSRG